MIYINGQEIGDVYVGSQAVDEIYNGSVLVFSSAPFAPDTVLIDYSQGITETIDLPKGYYYVEIVGGGGTGSYGQAGYWQERYGGGSGSRWSANMQVTGNHTISMVCGGGVGAASTLTIDSILVATAGGGGTPTAGSVTVGSTSITGIVFSNIESKNGNGGNRTFDVGGAYTGNAASVASTGKYGQGAGSGNGYGTDYDRHLGWIYLKYIGKRA